MIKSKNVCVIGNDVRDLKENIDLVYNILRGIK